MANNTGNEGWQHIPTVINLILAALLVLAAWRTDKTTTRQVELLDQVSHIVAEDTIIVARQEFNRALDDAESYCTGCSSCAPSYLVAIPLDIAVRNEPIAAEQLSAAEYNRLTLFGSAIWDFRKAELYGQKAIEKASGNDGTPLDRFMSHSVLGHIHFRHLIDDPEHATVEAARTHFRDAIIALGKEKGSDAACYYIGYGYELWAAHEAFLGNERESTQAVKVAKAWWSKLPEGKLLSEGLDIMIAKAKNGIRPEIACLFKSPSPKYVPAPSPKVAEPAEPTPAGPTPAPTPALVPTTYKRRF